MDLPFNIWLVFVSISLLISLLGIYLGFKKIAGAPFITVIGGIFLFAVTVMTVNIEGVSPDNIETIIQNTTFHMKQDTGTVSSFPLRSGANSFWGERALNDNSILVGDRMNGITITIDKDGNPTSDFYVGVWNGVTPPTLSNANFIVGQMYANKTTLTQSSYTFVRNDTKVYTIKTGDVIGVFYTGGSVGNLINTYQNATVNSFDNSDSVRTRFDTTTQTWGDASSGLDVRLRVFLVETQLDIAYDKYPFNQNEIWAYMIFISAIIMLIGGVFQKQDWA